MRIRSERTEEDGSGVLAMFDTLTAMREVRVEEQIDVVAARTETRARARALGFGRVASAELAIVASELASNILKYGVRGKLRIEEIESDSHGTGIRLTACDEGPPFSNFDLAMRDGFTDQGQIDPLLLVKRGGIGAGLGAVRRFSDEMGLVPTTQGKEVWAIRYVPRRARASVPPPRPKRRPAAG